VTTGGMNCFARAGPQELPPTKLSNTQHTEHRPVYRQTAN